MRALPLLLVLSCACAAEPRGDDGLPVGCRSMGVSCGGEVPPTAAFGPEIEALAAYDPQATCDPVARPGVIAFRDLVLATYTCTTDLGIVRACDVGGTSEHKEGRAWDWGVTVDNAAADDFFGWLLASDAHGNVHAMARRLGVMYIVWNHKIWGAYRADDGWRDYSGDPHTDHAHISFSWAGARGETSYWQVDGGVPPGDGGADDLPPPSDLGPPGPDLEAGPAGRADSGPSALGGSCAVGPASRGDPWPILLINFFLFIYFARRWRY